MADTYHILIVDDDDEHAEWIGEFLHISGPFTTERAHDVAEFWRKIAKNTYTAILLDYKLPDGTGLDTLEKIQQQGYQVPVIMITGQGDERIAVKAMQQGAADYMVKGAESLLTLPAIIKKAVQSHLLQLSAQRSMEQVRYQALLLNNVRDAVIVWNTEGEITYWNPAAEMLFECKASDYLGHAVKTCYLNKFTPPISESALDAPSHEAERRYQMPSGRTLWLSSRIGVLRDYESGRLLGYMDVLRDITARKKAEQELRIAQMRIAQTARLAAIGELASGVAHHINNPLTSIIGETHLLLLSLPRDHPGRESAETIEQAGWRVQQAVERLLDFSRPVTTSLENLDVNQTIHDALALVGESIRATSIHLDMDLSDELPTIYGNARQLSDLWVNLILMARDACSDGSDHTIAIRSLRAETAAAASTAHQIVVEVDDDGKQLAPEEIERLFEPDFFKPLSGRGTGIELTICHEIVRQHHGQITAQSKPGHGTIFRVALGGVA